jgi:Zn-dependent protease
VHSAELGRLAAAAQKAEAAGDLSGALASWRRATELLPAATEQRAQIVERMRGLSAAIDGRGPAPAGVGSKGSSKGAKTGAAVGAVGLAIAKSKALLMLLAGNAKLLLLGLFKLPTLLSMIVYARWMSGEGAGFGIGVVACIYVHEVGHVAALRRYGIDASAPMFIPGFGALVRLKQYPTDAHEEARTGLAGPLWGLVASLGAAAVGKIMGSQVATSVASVSAMINLFNLIPFWQLDGARGLKATSRGERWVIVAIAAATALVAHQWMPAHVAALTQPRAFDERADPKGDRGVLALIAGLIVALAAVASLPANVRW